MKPKVTETASYPVPLPSKYFQLLLGVPKSSVRYKCNASNAPPSSKHTQKTSKVGHPGGILLRCSNYLSWLPLMRRSISTLSSL